MSIGKKNPPQHEKRMPLLIGLIFCIQKHVMSPMRTLLNQESIYYEMAWKKSMMITLYLCMSEMRSELSEIIANIIHLCQGDTCLFEGPNTNFKREK